MCICLLKQSEGILTFSWGNNRSKNGKADTNRTKPQGDGKVDKASTEVHSKKHDSRQIWHKHAKNRGSSKERPKKAQEPDGYVWERMRPARTGLLSHWCLYAHMRASYMCACVGVWVPPAPKNQNCTNRRFCTVSVTDIEYSCR